jgi:hypothetical protein
MPKPAKDKRGDPAVLRHVDQCAIFLIKTLCLDTNATEANITQDLTHYGKTVGRYRVTITKL